jgi:hypothetical protein
VRHAADAGVRQLERSCAAAVANGEETDTGFRGFTRTPRASSYAPPCRVYGVF